MQISQKCVNCGMNNISTVRTKCPDCGGLLKLKATAYARGKGAARKKAGKR